MGSGNVLSASARLGLNNARVQFDAERMILLKKSKELENDMIHAQKVEASLKIQKLLLLGKYRTILL